MAMCGHELVKPFEVRWLRVRDIGSRPKAKQQPSFAQGFSAFCTLWVKATFLNLGWINPQGVNGVLPGGQ